MMKYPSLRPCSLALSRQKSTLLLLYSGVSGEFRYLGRESSITRPPNAITLPEMSRIGKMILPRNRQLGEAPDQHRRAGQPGEEDDRVEPLRLRCRSRP